MIQLLCRPLARLSSGKDNLKNSIKKDIFPVVAGEKCPFYIGVVKIE